MKHHHNPECDDVVSKRDKRQLGCSVDRVSQTPRWILRPHSQEWICRDESVPCSPRTLDSTEDTYVSFIAIPSRSRRNKTVGNLLSAYLSSGKQSAENDHGLSNNHASASSGMEKKADMLNVE